MLLKTPNARACIVYAHGLGSNKLEALSLAKFFPKHAFDICAFDFSGSGRSEGNFTSYGLLEQGDINAILSYLDANYTYDSYVLWGRSMGSVSMVLSQGNSLHKKVRCLVLDSPFSSFEKVAVEIASKKSFIPQFMMELLIEPLKEYCSTQHSIDPFQIDILQSLRKIDAKVLLLYSKNDSVVSHCHALELAKHCRRTPVQIEIEEDHNMQRSRETHTQILHFIDRCLNDCTRKTLVSRSKGISVASKGKDPSIRTNSKVKLTISEASLESCGRSIKTISSLNRSIDYSKRLETDTSPNKRRKIGAITSVCHDDRLSRLANKENIKPSLNMMRKNRFR
jgi:pimeloyl-ACP methyl ester carboxylesterase